MGQKNYRIEIIIAIIGVIGVLGAALIANWDKVFPPKPPGPVVSGKDSITPQVPTKKNTEPSMYVSDPEIESRTKFSKPRDAIHSFRIVKSDASSLVVEFDYTMNEKHGQKVMAEARLLPVQSFTVTPTLVPTMGKGTVRVPITVKGKQFTKQIRIFLYEVGKPGEVFAARVYPFEKSWNN